MNSQVNVVGANDIEPGFNSWSNTDSWIQGYTSVDPADYLDYGSADGCSQTDDQSSDGCNNGWTTGDEYTASWGAAPALPIPEIYCQPQVSQWTQIALNGAQYQGGAVYYQAPWDQYDLDQNDNFTSAQAWTQFWNGLNSYSSIAQTPPYSAEIHWENGQQNVSSMAC